MTYLAQDASDLEGWGNAVDSLLMTPGGRLVLGFALVVIVLRALTSDKASGFRAGVSGWAGRVFGPRDRSLDTDLVETRRQVEIVKAAHLAEREQYEARIDRLDTQLDSIQAQLDIYVGYSAYLGEWSTSTWVAVSAGTLDGIEKPMSLKQWLNHTGSGSTRVDTPPGTD